MTDERIVLGQIVLPPSKENCETAHCSQRACCDIEVRVAAEEREEASEEEFYVLPSCAAHAFWTLSGVLPYAESLYPPTPVDVSPWERDEE